MTIEEIFSQLSQHMIEGLMTHLQLSTYFNFLSLEGYNKCHEYHYYCETIAYNGLIEYYMKHYNKLIVNLPVVDPQVIPEKWFKYTRQDVDTTTRKNAIQAGFDKWITWEETTKSLYEEMYCKLVELKQIAAACYIKELICDVDCELAEAQQKYLEVKAIDFNISDIMTEQKEICKKYCKKLKEMEIGG